MAKRRKKTSKKTGKKRRAKKAGWGSARKYVKGAFKGQVPLDVLEKRLRRLNGIVKYRGGRTP